MAAPVSSGGAPISTRAPTAPPASLLAPIAGYEGARWGEAMAPPPPIAIPTAVPINTGVSMDAGLLSETDARMALQRYVQSDCCFGPGPAANARFVRMTPSSAFHIKVDTYVEMRQVTRVARPFRGEPYTAAGMGMPPSMWQVPLPAPVLFQEFNAAVEVPFTSTVTQCHECFGAGQERCEACMGMGNSVCMTCRGAGFHNQTVVTEFTERINDSVVEEVDVISQQRSPCQHCNGSGRQRCVTCMGFGHHRCCGCQGAGLCRYFLELVAKRTSLIHQQVIDYSTGSTSRLPPQLIERSSGRTLIEQTAQALSPLSGFAPEVNHCSGVLLQQTSQEVVSKSCLQHAQRISMRVVPITCCLVESDGQSWDFWVFGESKDVYAPNYPSQCCGCCVIV